MQNTTNSLAIAVTSPQRLIANTLSVDWDADGHDGTGSLDDLSQKVSSIKVQQALTTNVPAPAQVIPGAAVAQLDVTISHGNVFGLPVNVQYRSLATYVSGGSNITQVVTIVCPVGAQPGEVILVCIAGVQNGLTISESNASWNLLHHGTSQSLTTVMLMRKITAGDPTSYTFTLLEGASITAVAVCVANAAIAGLHAYSTLEYSIDLPPFTVLDGRQVTVTVDGCTLINFYNAMMINQSAPQWLAGVNETQRLTQNSGTTPLNVVQGVSTISNAPIGTYTPSATLIQGTSPLNPNSRFETNATGWALGAPSVGTISRTSERSHEGAWSIKGVAGGGAEIHIRSDEIVVSASTTYYFAGWFFADIDIVSGGFAIEWYNSSHVLISTSSIVTSHSAHNWDYVTGTVSSPVGAAFARIDGRVLDITPIGTAIYIDEVALMSTDTANVLSVAGVAYSIALMPAMSGNERQSAAWTYSELNLGGPLAGKQRDRRPVTWSVGFGTAAGIESVPVFTGYSLGVDVSARDRTATLTALDNRELFRGKTYLPFAVADWPRKTFADTYDYKPGLEATWAVSYILGKYQDDTRTGYYAAPPARPNTIVYAPMHGSMTPFIGFIYGAYTETAGDVRRAVRFNHGPYLGATEKAPYGGTVYARYAGTGTVVVIDNSGRAKGRFEFSGRFSSGVSSSLQLTAFSTSTANTQIVSTLTPNTAWQLLVTIAGTTRTINGPTVPNDGTWHNYGVHYDSQVGSALFYIDGVVTTVAFAALSGAVANGLADFIVTAVNYAQIAELHICGGVALTGFNPNYLVSTTSPWVFDGFVATAFIDRSVNTLEGVIYARDDDQWTTLTKIAEAEFAAIYFDARGYPHYRTSASDASVSGQTIARTLTSTASLLDVDYEANVSMVCNDITVPYSSIDIVLGGNVFSPSSATFLGKYDTIVFEFETPGRAFNLESVQFTFNGGNTSPDGSGIQLASSNFSFFAVINSDGFTGRVIISNASSYDIWLVTNTGSASFTIYNSYIKIGSNTTDAPNRIDEFSQVRHGEQPYLVPNSSWRQTRDFASALALKLIHDLSEIKPVIKNLQIVGDPRLEIGDRVQIQELLALGVDRPYRIASLTTEASSGSLKQSLACRDAPTVARWGINRWGDGTVWGV